ncbi:MAG: hypothetical protein MHM6MM_001981 [Cercozoa sp. M6MM]
MSAVLPLLLQSQLAASAVSRQNVPNLAGTVAPTPAHSRQCIAQPLVAVDTSASVPQVQPQVRQQVQQLQAKAPVLSLVSTRMASRSVIRKALLWSTATHLTFCTSVSRVEDALRKLGLETQSRRPKAQNLCVLSSPGAQAFAWSTDDPGRQKEHDMEQLRALQPDTSIPGFIQQRHHLFVNDGLLCVDAQSAMQVCHLLGELHRAQAAQIIEKLQQLLPATRAFARQVCCIVLDTLALARVSIPLVLEHLGLPVSVTDAAPASELVPRDDSNALPGSANENPLEVAAAKTASSLTLLVAQDLEQRGHFSHLCNYENLCRLGGLNRSLYTGTLMHLRLLRELNMEHRTALEKLDVDSVRTQVHSFSGELQRAAAGDNLPQFTCDQWTRAQILHLEAKLRKESASKAAQQAAQASLPIVQQQPPLQALDLSLLTPCMLRSQARDAVSIASNNSQQWRSTRSAAPSLSNIVRYGTDARTVLGNLSIMDTLNSTSSSAGCYSVMDSSALLARSLNLRNIMPFRHSKLVPQVPIQRQQEAVWSSASNVLADSAQQFPPMAPRKQRRPERRHRVPDPSFFISAVHRANSRLSPTTPLHNSFASNSAPNE